MLEPGNGGVDWIDQAALAMQAAGELLAGSLAEEAITSAFLAMAYAARATLEGGGDEISGWEDVVRDFQALALPRLGLSKENQRALPIVADLYRRVVDTGEMDADPVTAAACLEDARNFIAEIEAKLNC